MLNYRYVVYDTIHLYFTYKVKQLTPLQSESNMCVNEPIILKAIISRGIHNHTRRVQVSGDVIKEMTSTILKWVQNNNSFDTTWTDGDCEVIQLGSLKGEWEECLRYFLSKDRIIRLNIIIHISLSENRPTRPSLSLIKKSTELSTSIGILVSGRDRRLIKSDFSVSMSQNCVESNHHPQTSLTMSEGMLANWTHQDSNEYKRRRKITKLINTAQLSLPGNPLQAIALCTKAIAKYPESHVLLLLLSLAYSYAGDLRSSAEAFRRAEVLHLS